MEKNVLFEKIKVLIDKYSDHNFHHHDLYKETFEHISNIPFVMQLRKENEKLKTLKVGYLGTPNTKEEAYCVKTSPYIVNLGRTIEEKDIGTFNACCSLRNADIAFGKPGTKSFVAASLNSIIIASKEEYNIVDLFGEDYPYYLVEQGKTVGERLQKTIGYIA